MAPVDRRIAALLFVGLVAAYLVMQYGVMQSWDGRINAGVAKNIWEHHRFETFGDSFGVVGRTPFSKYGIGLSLLLAPMWFFNHNQGLDSAFWLTLVNPVLSAVAAVAIYVTGVHLAWRRRIALVTAFAFGLLTMVPVYSVELLPDTGTMMCVALLMLGLVRWRAFGPRNAWIVGAAVGGAILFRVESAITIAPAIAFVLLFVSTRELSRTRRSWIPAVVVPLAIVGLWLAYYNNLRYGSPFDVGPDSGLFDFPLLNGLWRQLGSTGKGFFWYNPILIAAAPGMLWLWKRDRPIVVVITALFFGRVLFFARFTSPDGDVAWGPRYLLPGCALLAIALGETLVHIDRAEAVRKRVSTAAVTALAGVSAVVVAAGLWVPYTYSWTIVNTVPGYEAMPSGQADAIVASRLHRQDNDWYWSPIVLNVRGGPAPRPFLLKWWKGGPSFGGVVLLLGALASAAAAYAATGERRTLNATPTIRSRDPSSVR